MSDFELAKLFVPGVSLLIAFLAYSSQYLFLHIEPSPIAGREFVQFNILVICIWICYYRTCTTDAGHVPKDWSFVEDPNLAKSPSGSDAAPFRQRWCRKCEALKPPRSHHCKKCARCVPKMDHHCPWTANCVSHFTMPHFMRFLFYTNAALIYLEYFLYMRGAVVWSNRNLPSYLGPSAGQLVHLFLLIIVNSVTLILLFILFVRAAWSLGGNVTMIEGWEIERHDRLLLRSRALGGYLDGPDGVRIKIQRQEFPYDIGIWSNLKQGMGGGSVLTWLWPFAASPRSSGLEFEVNGFEDEFTTWPPPDPDRIPRLQRSFNPNEAFTYPNRPLSDYEEIQAFKQRQQEDMRRRQVQQDLQRRKPFAARFTQDALPLPDEGDVDAGSSDEGSHSGEEGWRDTEGNRLRDYGVDEDAEFYDEDEVPLSELMRRRKQHNI